MTVWAIKVCAYNRSSRWICTDMSRISTDRLYAYPSKMDLIHHHPWQTNRLYNPFLVYCRELAPGTVSLTGDWAQGDDSKHDSYYSKFINIFNSKVWITCIWWNTKVSKCAKIRNRYNQVPHLTQDTNGKVTDSQLDITNESQEVSPFPAGDHKAHISRRTQRHTKHKTEQKHKRSTKEVPPWNGQ